MRKNKNRGYQQLRVWTDAIEFYTLNSHVFLELPYSLKRMSSQQLASSDSVHRNIAEGYCRRSIKEYIPLLFGKPPCKKSEARISKSEINTKYKC